MYRYIKINLDDIRDEQIVNFISGDIAIKEVLT